MMKETPRGIHCLPSPLDLASSFGVAAPGLPHGTERVETGSCPDVGRYLWAGLRGVLQLKSGGPGPELFPFRIHLKTWEKEVKDTEKGRPYLCLPQKELLTPSSCPPIQKLRW